MKIDKPIKWETPEYIKNFEDYFCVKLPKLIKKNKAKL